MCGDCKVVHRIARPSNGATAGANHQGDPEVDEIVSCAAELFAKFGSAGLAILTREAERYLGDQDLESAFVCC